MSGNIVADTSCLILLEKLKKIDLLQSLFGKVTITSTIANEYGNKLPDFIEIENPQDTNYQKILESYLDAGEASALALALEKENCLLIIDDYKARREAKQLNIDFTGTIGVLIHAKEKGLIDSLTKIINDINKTNFRISDTLIQEIKRISGE